MTQAECDTLKRYASNGISAKAEISRLKDKLESAEKTASIWKQRYEKLHDKFEELKKEVQPYLDAVKLAPERVRAFLYAILARGKETQEHKHPARRYGQDMEL